MNRLVVGIRAVGCALLLAATVASAPSFATPDAAEDGKKAKSKKKKATKADDAFADLFGAPAATGGDLESLKAATSGLKKNNGGAALKPKAAKIRDGADVSFPMIFAAERIKLDRKRGCIPATRRMVRIKELQFSLLPAQTPTFSVCLRMASNVGRLMRMSVTFVGPRMKRVAHADSVADFTGKDELDHILDWPALNIEAPGIYHYVVDLDGKRVAKIPVFEVKDGEEDTVTGDVDTPPTK